MAEISWIKVDPRSFDDNKIRIISKMPQGDMILCTWFRLLFEAGKNNDNGYIYVNKDIPYTCDMLSSLFDKSVKKIKLALKTLKDFMMIDIEENDFIKITNWEKYQNVEKMNSLKDEEEEKLRKIREQGRIRAARYRQRKRNSKSRSICEELNEIKENSKSEKEMFLSNHKESIQNTTIQEISNSEESNKNISDKENNVIVTQSDVTVTDKNKIRERNRYREEQDKEIVTLCDIKERDDVTENNALLTEKDSHIITQKSNSEIYNQENNEVLSMYQMDNNSHDYYKPTKIEQLAINIITSYEKVTGKFGWLDLSILKQMLNEHEAKYVEMAIGRAVNAKTLRMNYIAGILRNWKNCGYPENEGENINGRGNKFSLRADKEKYRGIKGECRFELSNEEWRELEKELI